MSPLLESTPLGLYCAAGDFFIDPRGATDCAVITHAHSDHARAGSRLYLTATPGVGVLRQRLGPAATIEGIPYGQRVTRKGVSLSLHPAGHILGSAQVRMEYQGQIWVVSGDYKLENDGVCAPFEPVRCHTFVTESTFALPIYRWRPQAEIFAEINQWWRENQSAGRASVLFGYSLGKAQRLLSGLEDGLGPIFVHGAVAKFLPAHAAAGVKLPSVVPVGGVGKIQPGALVLAPPSAGDSPWLRRFGEISTGFASGWMRLRGARRGRAFDRGFVISDHADWDGLLAAIAATGAEKILVTHGYAAPLVRWLREKDIAADVLPTHFKSGNDGAISDPLSL